MVLDDQLNTNSAWSSTQKQRKHEDPLNTNAIHYDPPRTDDAWSSASIILVTANRPATLHFPQDWWGAEVHSPDDNLRALRQALARAPQACNDLTHLHDVLQTHHLNHGITHIWNIPKVKTTSEMYPKLKSLPHLKRAKSHGQSPETYSKSMSLSHLKQAQSQGHCHIWNKPKVKVSHQKHTHSQSQCHFCKISWQCHCHIWNVPSQTRVTDTSWMWPKSRSLSDLNCIPKSTLLSVSMHLTFTYKW